MSWTLGIGIVAGFVLGVNVGVLLMVALQAGRRQDEAWEGAALRARIETLEASLVRQSQASPSMLATVERPVATTTGEDARSHLSHPA
jgi:hypothetical protein